MDIGIIIYYAVGVSSIILGSVIAVLSTSFYDIKLPRWLIILLCVSSIYIPLAQYLKYSSLHFYVDFSHWVELLNNISCTGQPITNSIALSYPGCVNYLSVHFVPLIYILALPYKVWPKSETIIVLNYLIMASSVVPIYKLAALKNRGKEFSLFAVFMLLWYPTFQYTVLYEFEMLRFCIPILLWVLYFWEKKSLYLYYVFLLLAVLVREEVGLTVALFGMYLLMFQKQRLHGFTTAVLGVLAFVIITGVVMPYLRGGASYSHVAAGSFLNFGTSPMKVALNVFSHPAFFIKIVADPVKIANITMMFVPFVFVPLLAPAVLMNILANVGFGLLSDSYTHGSYMLYYLSPSVPFIIYALIKAWPRFERLLKHACPTKKITGVCTERSAVVMFVAMMMANIFFGPSFVSLQFWLKDVRMAPFRTMNFHYTGYVVNQHHRNLDHITSMIPKSAVVTTQHFIFPRLCNKKGTMILPALISVDGMTQADYLLFDATNNNLSEKSPAFKHKADIDRIVADENNWKLIYLFDNYFLYKRVGNFG